MLELDPKLQELILGLITLLVTDGLKSLGALLKIDISGAASAIIAGVVALVLAFINGLFGFVPPEFHEVARVVMNLLVTILLAFGAYRQLKNFRPAQG